MNIGVKPRQLAAWVGMAAPVLFMGVFTFEGWLRPGYDPRAMYISALSLGPRGWVQMVNFLVFGALFFFFTWAVAGVFPTGKGSRGGVTVLRVMAALYFVSGPFVMDPMWTPPDQVTVTGTIHGAAGGFVFILMPISIFVYLRRFREDPEWAAFKNWTLILGVIEALGVLFFTIVSKVPVLIEAFMPWHGLIQRVALVPFMIWLFLFAWQVKQRSPQA